MSELKQCPFCGGDAEKTQTGDNFVIVRCLTIYCQSSPSSVCYKDDKGEYDFYPWNNRAEISPIEGKQLVSEEAIKYLHDQWPVAYKAFCDKL